MAEKILELCHLSKSYRKHKVLDQVDLVLHRGEIYGLVGRNGAGKTTLMRVISSLTRADSGQVKIFGQDLSEQPHLLGRIGALIETPALYPQLTAFQNMELKALAIGLTDRREISELLALFDLEALAKKKVKHYSLGMKQRLAMAMALLGHPDLLLLDEPVNGLDPEGIVSVRQTLLHLAREKQIAMIISSHILDELARTSQRIGIIEHGQIIEDLEMSELQRRCQQKIVITSEEIDRVVGVLEEEFRLRRLRVISPELVEVYEQVDKIQEINRALIQAGISVQGITVNMLDLEDYFLQRIGGGKHA